MNRLLIIYLFLGYLLANNIDYSKLNPIHRYYDPIKRYHYYSHSQFYSNKDFKYQGIEFFAYKEKLAGTIPVYRYTHSKLNTHFYTTNAVPEKGYKKQEISFYAFKEESSEVQPIYRFYNTRDNEHYYTREKNPEKNYKPQGVEFYAISPDFFKRNSTNYTKDLIKRPTFKIDNRGKWNTDYDLALSIAKKEEKPLLLNFTGSDWCGWCIRLKDEVFDKDAFKEFSKNNLILVELDFPKRKELPKEVKNQNNQLNRKYGITGFPTIILIDAFGEIIQKTGYLRGGAESYVNHLKSILNL